MDYGLVKMFFSVASVNLHLCTPNENRFVVKNNIFALSVSQMSNKCANKSATLDYSFKRD